MRATILDYNYERRRHRELIPSDFLRYLPLLKGVRVVQPIWSKITFASNSTTPTHTAAAAAAAAAASADDASTDVTAGTKGQFMCSVKSNAE